MGRMFNLLAKIMHPFMGKGYSTTILGRFIYKNIFLKLKPNFIEINGMRLYLPKQDISTEKMMVKRTYEPIETKQIIKNIIQNDIVVDIGSNIGYYTILVSRIVGDKGKVYAFEPNKEILPILKKNIEINSCKNVSIIQKAVSEKNGRIKFYLMEENKAQSSTYKSGESNEEVEVDSVSLDKFFSGKKKPNFIKMDIEGGELNALKGAKKLLKKNIKIFLEYKPLKLKRQGLDPEEIKKILMDNKFKIKRLKESLYCEK